LREPRELARDPLHGTACLDVRVEQVPRDEEQVDLLRDGEVDARLARAELALTLGDGGVPEVGVARAEVDVCGMQQAEHAVGCLPEPRPSGSRRATRPHSPSAPDVPTGPASGRSSDLLPLDLARSRARLE